MLRALWAAASGMIAQQTAVDVISHNLANVNTPGFKASRVEFGDVLSAAPGSTAVAGGAGVRVVGSRRSCLPGQLENTEQPLDLAVQGPGFFRVELGNGETLYTRSGAFHLGPDGRIYTAQGYRLAVSSWSGQAGVDPAALRVDRDGRVWTQTSGGAQALGQISMVTFPNPEGLEAVGDGLYRKTAASGEPVTSGQPGEIWQGYLERSNVQVVEDLVGLIMAQRAYEMNSKVVQAADDMLGMANNLRR